MAQETIDVGELAGPVGRELAGEMAGKAVSVIEGFPSSTPRQRWAIATLVATRIETYAAAWKDES